MARIYVAPMERYELNLTFMRLACNNITINEQQDDYKSTDDLLSKMCLI